MGIILIMWLAGTSHRVIRTYLFAGTPRVQERAEKDNDRDDFQSIPGLMNSKQKLPYYPGLSSPEGIGSPGRKGTKKMGSQTAAHLDKY